VIATYQGSAVPSLTVLIQVKRSSDPTIPRFRVTSSSLCVLGILRAVLNFSLPLRYSAQLISIQTNQPSVVEIVPGHGGAVAAHEESLVRLIT